ncbi:MAG: hypothetical protein GY749_43150 [Desulfobacteraceae bacterium]|nr:hypothetical protein [Desulfobacteraceae bacterium]
MNIYFLVEGKTEKKVYPAWLSYLVPNIQRVNFSDEVHENNYKIVNAGGQPFYPEILNAVNEINSVGRYHYFAICLDAEENSVNEIREDIYQFMEHKQAELTNTQLILIIQNRCMETWFLGNQRIYSRNPQNPDLAEYTQFYDVSAQDPEMMGTYQGFNAHAQFHEAYLKALLAAKKISYSKKNPGHVLDQPYLDQLLSRISNKPEHLESFQYFINFCRTLSESDIR